MQKDTEVRLGHGSGGAMMKRLIDDLFLDEFSDEATTRASCPWEANASP